MSVASPSRATPSPGRTHVSGGSLSPSGSSAGSPRFRACASCHRNKTQCNDYDDGMCCARCRRRGISCSGPEMMAVKAPPKRWTRQPKGTIISSLKVSLPTVNSATAKLNGTEMSAALQWALVKSYESRFLQQKKTSAEIEHQTTKDVWQVQVEKAGLEEIQTACFAALGAKVSSHSAIIGRAPSARAASVARHGCFVALADRAVKLGTAAGLFANRPVSVGSYIATLLLDYVIKGLPFKHSSLIEVNTKMIAQRTKILTDATIDEGLRENLRLGDGLNLLLSDVMECVQIGAEKPMLSNNELKVHFGWTKSKVRSAVDYIVATGAEAHADEGWVPTTERGEKLMASATRVAVSILRNLIELRRRAWEGDVVFAEAAVLLQPIVTTLTQLETAYRHILTRVQDRRPSLTPTQDTDPALWAKYLPFIDRRQTALWMFAYECTSLLVKASNPGFAPDQAEEHGRLVAEVERTTARKVQRMVSEADGPLLIPDYFKRPSLIGGWFPSLPPGVEAMELACRACEHGMYGGRLEGIGMTMGNLETFLDALHQTEQLMGPSAEQARALERGINELKAPRGLQLSEADSAEVARGMVDRALADLAGQD